MDHRRARCQRTCDSGAHLVLPIPPFRMGTGPVVRAGDGGRFVRFRFLLCVSIARSSGLRAMSSELVAVYALVRTLSCRFERARLQPRCTERLKRAGIRVCGKTLATAVALKGLGFSRAISAAKSTRL